MFSSPLRNPILYSVESSCRTLWKLLLFWRSNPIYWWPWALATSQHLRLTRRFGCSWVNFISGQSELSSALTLCMLKGLDETSKCVCMCCHFLTHYNDVIMGAIASQITNLTPVYSTVYPGADQRKHQSSASLAFVRGIHPGPANSPHKWPVARKMIPFDDVIMNEMTQAVEI